MDADKIVRDFCAAFGRGDVDAIVDAFTDDAVYHNIPMTRIEGREAIRVMAKAWPRVVNREEWRAIDGARLAIGWNERKYDGPEDALYRGMSTFVFDTEHLLERPSPLAATVAPMCAVTGCVVCVRLDESHQVEDAVALITTAFPNGTGAPQVVCEQALTEAQTEVLHERRMAARPASSPPDPDDELRGGPVQGAPAPW